MSNVVKIILAVLIGLIVIGVCIVAGVLIWRTISGPEATAVPTPTTEAVLPPTTGPEVDDSWERVQAAGKLVIGTAADYPPFEYYVGNRQITGFDIAMMDEIGRRLGVTVDYRDFAFDGLGNAIMLQQVDAAIAAISVTPERESYVDFSNVYLVGEDAVLAAEGSSISAINAVGDMAPYRLGVQRGTVYDQWLQRELVDTGLMPDTQLFVYDKGEFAVRDLQEGRLDLIMGDLQPAEVAVGTGGLKIVGRGLNQQRYAIALPKGAQSLKAEIDSALTAMYNEGVIAQLAKEYLDIENLLPTPVPVPTSTPAPPPACVDGMAFEGYPGLSGDPITNPPVRQPGENFTWTWRVKNTGTCTWDSSYRAVYVTGNSSAARMGGEPTPIQGTVAPGQSYDLAVRLAAPLQPGTYLGVWELENGQTQGFGERLQVAAQVTSARPTATPAPTQTPVAGISFTVDRTNIKQGECVTFSWRADNVKAVYFYHEGENWPDHGVAGEGRQQECPPFNLTYYLRVVKLDDSVDIRQITIYVEPAAQAPQITQFSADPPNQITQGQCVTLRWQVEGNVSQIRLSRNGNSLWDGAPLKGQFQDCPPGPGQVAFLLEATGPGGTSRGQQNVNVVGAATATPAPTPAPEAPVIQSFAAIPDQINAGECVQLTWTTGGGTNFVKVVSGDRTVYPDAPLSGTTSDCPPDTGTVPYRVIAYNAADDRVFEVREVQVNP
jgi:ABC-type amino acid transport substrate-binding protein